MNDEAADGFSDAPNASGNEEHAVTLSQRGKSPASVLSLAKTTSPILDTTCNPANVIAAGPVKGDYGATIQFNLGTLGAGKTAGGTVQYRRDRGSAFATGSARRASVAQGGGRCRGGPSSAHAGHRSCGGSKHPEVFLRKTRDHLQFYATS